MFIRLAMVACFGPHDGPWLRARGNEVGIRVEHLGVGEYISVVYQDKSSQTNSYLIDKAGDSPIPTDFKRIRFRKLGGNKPTNVALLVNG